MRIDANKIHEEYKAAGFSDEQVHLACHILSDVLLLLQKETQYLMNRIEELTTTVASQGKLTTHSLN